MLGDNPRDNLLVSMQFNMARSETLHAALKQASDLVLDCCTVKFDLYKCLRFVLSKR